MKLGQVVYTINAKTNQLDTWLFNGTIQADKETLIALVNRDKRCMLPKRCVFDDKTIALNVLESCKKK